MPNLRMMFPGANSGQGFYSFYQYITPEDARHKYILKGGPGVGKSHLMKTLGDRCRQEGLDVEFHWCSSDNNSLDGLSLPRYQVAVVDGTSPHVVDPRYPGAVDEIVNLGGCWHRRLLVDSRAAIISTARDISLLFQRAYVHLATAAQIYREAELLTSPYLRPDRLHILARELAALLATEPSPMPFASPFKTRHLFASAITPGGTVSHLDSLLAPGTQVYTLQGLGGDRIMDYVARQAEMNGHIMECYHCPLFPERIEGLYLPQLGLALVNLSRQIITELPAKAAKFNCQAIELNQHLTAGLDYHEITRIQLRVTVAVNDAISLLRQAKNRHDDLETHYIAAMDFSAVDAVRDHLFQDILSWCHEE